MNGEAVLELLLYRRCSFHSFVLISYLSHVALVAHSSNTVTEY
jgi:hypothetical protein